ncbi:DUF1015 domain-containing protein [Rhodoferax sp.]|uniref:DUF1015 domain-containing protein n=1 Tax=Rhodoferax sp. TaxID=50421 RepID=UPI00284F0B6B|nr:DUF1015 domain-containing protein [Rhodoferax sp.]MDR3370941.1 DUF1015 domain-containing protein [Rhodoferax sp.]
MKNYSDIGIQIPQVVLPKAGTDLQKWAVVACDQYTSEPSYWQDVQRLVGEAPSTLNLIFPEVYLEQAGAPERIAAISRTMNTYLQADLFEQHEGLVYIERTVAGKTRHGIMLCLDLECYDIRAGSSSLIRPTEGTIVDRLPPRIKIREAAALELPHILVLVDDPEHSVIAPLTAAKAGFEPLYDVELMQGGGHLAGFAVTLEAQDQVVQALRALAQPDTFAAKYGVDQDQPVLLFAMGDGNHSLATAKAIWDKKKPLVGMDHPSRYALVEIENVHDHALEFEPIHRVLFGLKKDLLAELSRAWAGRFTYTEVATAAAMIQRVDGAQGAKQVVGLVGGGQTFGVIEIDQPSSNLAVGTLQTFLDQFVQDAGADAIDYVHGADVLERLALQPGNAGFYLAGMPKTDLFKTVILEGALPRKTFSLGQAHEKRFYMEARKIG